MRVALMVGGVVAGLGLGELLARWADGGAFSHLHIYQHDDVLGTTLVPGEGQWVAPAGNPRTWVEVNDAGFRGEAWPAPKPGEVVIVGDSQVFGLGVENKHTTPVAVDRHLTESGWTHVLNAGVPTYGPDEYLQVADHVLGERPARDLVVVFNLANDLFELEVPNVDRHAVWDGWAVRSETAPLRVHDFPGRAWLYQRSHLFFAMRRAWHPQDPSLKDGLPSEGGVQTVVQALTGIDHAEPDHTWRRDQAEAYREAVGKLSNTDVPRLAGLYAQLNHVGHDEDHLLQVVERNAHPGDIVHDRFAESSRRIEVTAGMIQAAAQVKRDLPDRMARWLARNPDARQAEQVRRALGDPALREEAERLAREIPPAQLATPMERWLDRVAALGVEHDVRVHVVYLPLDVQVSAAEFAKYGAEPIDLSASRQLIEALVQTTRARGVHAISLLEPLQRAEPGAFLDGDLHMTAKGHDAAGQAIAEELQHPSPVMARPGMPEGRSRVPLDREYDLIRENRVTGSTKLRCETKEVREWLRVRCFDGRGVGVKAVDLSKAPAEAFAVRGKDHVALYLPMLDGRDADVGLRFPSGGQSLQLRWTDVRTLGFVPADLSEEYDAPLLGAARSCEASEDVDACVDGIGAVSPRCAAGTALAGAAGWCLPVCDEHRPCAVGQCGAWQGIDVCL